MQTLTTTPLFRPPASGRWARRRPQPGLALAVLCVHGWVMALVHIDPETDWGQVGPQLDPRSTVCVPEKRVKHAE